GLADGDAEAAAGAAPNTKRRASRSDASRARAEIEIPGTLTPRRRVTLIDMGRGGVSFFDNRAWSAGAKLVIRLPRSPEEVIPLLCIVRNSRAVDGWFRVGLEFVNHYEAGGTMLMQEPSEPAADATEPQADPGRRAPRKRFGRAAAPAQLHTYEM